jgi:serine phosphatase RsbU (regulator of sigma subunit)
MRGSLDFARDDTRGREKPPRDNCVHSHQMSLRSRVILAVVIAAVTVGATTFYAATRIRQWHELGMTGLIFFPVMPPEKQPPLKAFQPGRVFMTYWSAPAERAGVKPGDELVSIGGISAKDNEALIANARKYRNGDKVHYRIRRGSRTFDVAVPLASPLRVPLYVASCVVVLLVGGAYLAIGVLVLAKRPDDRRVLVFFAMMCVGALYLLGTPALALESSDLRGLHGAIPGRGMLPAVTMFTALIAFLPLTLHLALVFPRERPVMRSSPRVLRWVYGVPATLVFSLMLLGAIGTVTMQSSAAEKKLDLPLNIFAAAVTLAGLGVAWRVARTSRGERLRDAFWHRPLQSILVIVAVLFGFGRVADALDIKWLAIVAAVVLVLVPLLAIVSFPILSCISLYRSYRDAGAEERRQVKWPLWGLLIALVSRIVIGVVTQGAVMYMMFTGGDFGRWVSAAQVIGIFSILVYLLIPISFAVAILKYRLMNIDVIIRKTVVYALLSGAIVVVYLAVVGILGTLLVRFAEVENQTMIIAATLVVALVFVPIRNKLQAFAERTLFRHKYDYPAALRAIAADALAASDLGTFLAAAAEKTQQVLQNRAVVIFASRHEELFAAAKVGVADSLLGALRISRASIHGSLDRPFDPRRHALPDEVAAALKRIEASLVVPINTPGTPANGFLALAPKLSGAEFDVEDIDFLRSVADQIDIGMDRVRLQREDEDYSQARAIQQTLIPREMPRLVGIDVSGTWQPARTMGGDYYDLLKLSDTELAICIGDVAGKGMPAALLMSGLQAAVRASASSSPRDLCERVRRVVVSSLSGGRFVTFFYATVDTAAMKLRWSNAGHNAPILARADGTIVRLEEGGPAISRLFRDTPYVESEIAIAPGDRIVLFTDGVSEAANDGEMFGEERIEELVLAMPEASAERLQQTIVGAAVSFAGGEVEDDLTLVAVRLA